MKNQNSTRYYSSKQEEHVAELLGGRTNSSSGSSAFNKGDVIVKDASLLVECKTSMTDKTSYSIKKEVLEKSRTEARSMRLLNNALCFNFGPSQPNFYVIDETLFSILVSSLKENYKD